MIYEPTGHFILVKELNEANFKTESNIELISNQFVNGIVVETSELPEHQTMYPAGQKIRFSANSGMPEMYNGEQHLWLNAKPFPDGEILAKISE